MACSLSTFTVISQAVSALAYSNETQRLQQLFIQLSQYGNLGVQGNHQTANRAFTTYVRPVVGHYLGRYWSTIPPSGLPDMHRPYLKDKLELVQRRFTKRLQGFVTFRMQHV